METKNKKQQQFKIPPLFLERLAKTKKEKVEKEILKTFHKVEINISLLDDIKQIPHYAKFLKELCTNRRKLVEHEKVSMRKSVYAVIQRKLPTKCKD